MPGPLAIWAAKKALKSKTGQKVIAAGKAKVAESMANFNRTGAGSDHPSYPHYKPGHASLSGHQFPDSPPWGETSRSATDTPDFDDVPKRSTPDFDKPPPW